MRIFHAFTDTRPADPAMSERFSGEGAVCNPFDADGYGAQHHRADVLLSDYSRIATRYGCLTRNFGSAVDLVAVITWRA